jgi:hypothetical protein
VIGASSFGSVTDTYFTHIESMVSDGAERFRAEVTTGGPWSAEFQHGGPPNALAVAIAEQTVAEETGRRDFVGVRLSADFVGPVPVADLLVRPRLLRGARSAALVEVEFSADPDGAERRCLLARVWFVADRDTSVVAAPLAPAAEVPQGTHGLAADFPYGNSLEWRFVRGRFDAPGPAAAWVRPRVALFDGHEMSGLARAVLIADSASGISAELSWQEWTFLNVDLDVHLARPPASPWLLMSAATQLGPNGYAVARSSLSDVHGPCGGGLQTLVLAPARR